MIINKREKFPLINMHVFLQGETRDDLLNQSLVIMSISLAKPHSVDRYYLLVFAGYWGLPNVAKNLNSCSFFITFVELFNSIRRCIYRENIEYFIQ